MREGMSVERLPGEGIQLMPSVVDVADRVVRAVHPDYRLFVMFKHMTSDEDYAIFACASADEGAARIQQFLEKAKQDITSCIRESIEMAKKESAAKEAEHRSSVMDDYTEDK